jgi:hypothetical protein
MSDAEQQADASPRRGPGIACAVMGIAAFLCVCGGATWSVTRLYDWASTEADRIQEVLTEEARDAAPTVLNLSAGDAKPDQVKLAAQVLRERMATLGIEASVTIGTGGRIDIALSTEDVTRAVPVLLAGGDLQFKLVSTLAGPERDAAIAKVQAEREAATYDAEAAPFDVVMQGDSPLLVEKPSGSNLARQARSAFAPSRPRTSGAPWQWSSTESSKSHRASTTPSTEAGSS